MENTSVNSMTEHIWDFHGLSDEMVVGLARDGNRAAMDYIIDKYKNFVKIKAKAYFLIGADRDDIVQEGMVGLFKAVRDFREDKLSSFRAFAELCIVRQIITAIKTATRQKHQPLNTYISLSKPVYEDDSERTLAETLTSNKVTDPEELFINREQIVTIETKMEDILSSFELKVLLCYLEGKSYQDIALLVEKHPKSIDNALQRVKKKLEKYLLEGEDGGDDDTERRIG